MLQHANSNNVSYYTIVNLIAKVRMTRFKQTIEALALSLAAITLSLLMHAIPVRQIVDIGGYDSTYTQGFFDQQTTPAQFGSNGNSRWSSDSSAFRLPLIGLPSSIEIDVAAPRSLVLGLTTRSGHNQYEFHNAYVWQKLSLSITDGYTKLADTPVVLTSSLSPWQKGDLRKVGVLVDTITYQSPWFALPYPSILALTVLLALLLSTSIPQHKIPTSYWRIVLYAAIPNIVVALCIRWPFASFLVWPEALVWTTMAAIGTIVWRHREAVKAEWERHQEWYIAVSIVLWTATMAAIQRSHLTLVVPGVEKDFRSFASRAENIESVLQADPFYQFGYPAFLWIGRQLTGFHIFTVATTWAVLVAALALTTSWYIARHVLGRGWDVLVVAILAGSSFFGEYALLIGSDMTFTAATMLSLATLLWCLDAPQRRLRWVWVGVSIGVAYLVRHTGLVLSIPVLLAVFWVGRSTRDRWLLAGFVCLGWVVCSMPQLYVNVRDTGEIFYNHQAKNSWLAVYGNLDWGRWSDVPDDIPLREVIFNDPLRFLMSWWNTVVSVIGTGATANEHDTALWQRLLTVPFNWFSSVGIVWLGVQLLKQRFDVKRDVLLVWAASFVVVSAIAFILPRMLLPLTIIASITATYGIRAVLKHIPQIHGMLIAGILVTGICVGVAATAINIRDGQPIDERMALAYLTALQPERLAIIVPAESPAGKYSVLAERVILRTTKYPVDPSLLCDAKADYALWSNELVPPDPRLVPLQRIGKYWIFQLAESPAYCTPQ